jgi:hypothetical protein
MATEGKTEVIQGTDAIINNNVRDLYKIKKTFDICSDRLSTFGYVSFKPVWEGLCDLNERGVQIRLITEITAQNLEYCKKLSTITEVRHLDNVKGNFGISDGIDYRATAKLDEKKLAPIEAIQSTVKVFVEQQQYFFDTLWDKAIPAEQKVKEIEEGIVPDFINTITDPVKIKETQSNLLKSAELEILLVFPTNKVFYCHEEYVKIIHFLMELSTLNPSLQIRIMMPENHKIEHNYRKLKGQVSNNAIRIQYLAQQPETTVLILVVDRKNSLYIEVKDTDDESSLKTDASDNNVDSIFGLATFSNSKATVGGYASIFESLWKQSEIYRKLNESIVQLDDARTRLQDMQQYVQYILKEKHKHKS